MKLDAVYGPEDFLELVKADIAAKGYTLVDEIIVDAFIDCAVSFRVETAKVVKAAPKHYKPREVTEKEAARRVAAGERLKAMNAAKKAVGPDPEADPLDLAMPVPMPEPEVKPKRHYEKKEREQEVALPIERPLPA